MRVLVTGASGLIGSALCDALLARGDEVVGLSRDPERARETNPTVSWHAWNPTLERPPDEALEGVDGVVNLVGESLNQRWTDEAKKRIRDSRVDARPATWSRRSLRATPTPACRWSASPPSATTATAARRSSTSRRRPGSDFDAQVVVDWEAAAQEVENAGVRLAITRTGARARPPAAACSSSCCCRSSSASAGRSPAATSTCPGSTLDDEVGLMLWALGDERVAGPLNATAPEPVTNREFSKALGRVLGRPAVVPVPKLALSALRGGELAETIAGGQRVLPRRTLDLGYEFRYPEPGAGAARRAQLIRSSGSDVVDLPLAVDQAQIDALDVLVDGGDGLGIGVGLLDRSAVLGLRRSPAGRLTA